MTPPLLTVPYFRDTDPQLLHTDNVIKPNNIISFLLGILTIFLSPIYSVAGWNFYNTILQIGLSTIFIEFNSGLFHIVFDNEQLNTYPIIGELAIDFQKHHFQPAGITKLPICIFLQQVHAPALIIIGTQVVLTFKYDTLRPFWFFCIIWTHIMFLAHRWAHILPKHNHYIVQWCQNHNILLCMKHHIQHHKTYDCNFSIFMGWSNSLLNYSTKYIISHNNIVYLYIYIFYFFIPTLLCFGDTLIIVD